MAQPTELTLTAQAWQEIHATAEEAFPEECCGVVIAHGGSERVQRLENIQNELHALDPETYPRTAVIAYAWTRRSWSPGHRSATRTAPGSRHFITPIRTTMLTFPTKTSVRQPLWRTDLSRAAQIVVSIYVAR